jgi:branched-chain amino acid transport system substrate-binding protein
MNFFWKQNIVSVVLGVACIGTLQAQEKQAKVGILNDQTGPLSALSGPGSVAAARMAIEDAGLVLGKPVLLVVGDHTNKPDVGSAIARRWFDTEGVGAVFDIYSSGVALAVQKVTAEKDRILVTTSSSRDLTGKNCTNSSFHWTNDGYSIANLQLKGAAGNKPNTWFFLTVDYAAGHGAEADAKQMIQSNGGTFVGSVRFPLGSPDFSSYLLQAQASKAKNIAFIGGGVDISNATKQVVEYGIQKAGQIYVPFTLLSEDVFALGNKTAAGLPIITTFYWDESPATKAWSERFKKITGKMPTDPQANVYSAVSHYLKAVKAAGTTETKAVLEKMKALPVQDFFTNNARIRADGRLMRDSLYATVKSPEQMKYPEDIMTVVKKYSGEESFMPVAMSECPLLKK